MIVSGLSSEIEVVSFRSFRSLAGSGKGVMVVGNPQLSQTSLIRQQIRKTITVTNDAETMTYFVGEITRVVYGQNVATYELKDGARKLLNQTTNYNPVEKTGFISGYLEDDVLEDRNQDFTGLENYLLKCVKNDSNLYRSISTPHTASYFDIDDNPYTPTFVSIDESVGIVNDIAADYETDRTNNVLGATDDVTIDDLPPDDRGNWKLQLRFKNYLKTGTTITKARLVIQLQFMRFDYYDATARHPEIRFWDYNTSTWGQIELILSSTYGDSADEDPPTFTAPNVVWQDFSDWITVEVELSGPSNYFNEDISGENEAGFKIYHSLVELFVGKAADVLVDVEGFPTAYGFNAVYVKNATMIIETDIPQDPDFGVGLIQTVNSDEIQLVDPSTWGMDDFPQADGFCQGDSYSIVPDATHLMANAWSASDTLFTLNRAAFSAAGIAITDDLTDVSLFDLLQLVSILSNAAFWYNADENTVYIATTFESISSFILTSADVIGWEYDAWSYSVDSASEFNYVVIVGARDDIRYKVAITPLDTLTQGDETVIRRDNEITSVNEAKNYSDTIDSIYTRPDYIMELSIDLDDPPSGQSAYYLQLELGKLVELQLPSASDTSLANHTDDESLMVYAMEFENSIETGQKDMLSLTLQRRYESDFSSETGGFDPLVWNDQGTDMNKLYWNVIDDKINAVIGSFDLDESEYLIKYKQMDLPSSTNTIRVKVDYKLRATSDGKDDITFGVVLYNCNPNGTEGTDFPGGQDESPWQGDDYEYFFRPANGGDYIATSNPGRVDQLLTFTGGYTTSHKRVARTHSNRASGLSDGGENGTGDSDFTTISAYFTAEDSVLLEIIRSSAGVVTFNVKETNGTIRWTDTVSGLNLGHMALTKWIGLYVNVVNDDLVGDEYVRFYDIVHSEQ